MRSFPVEKLFINFGETLCLSSFPFWIFVGRSLPKRIENVVVCEYMPLYSHCFVDHNTHYNSSCVEVNLHGNWP